MSPLLNHTHEIASVCMSLMVAENSHTATNYLRVTGGQKENGDITILQQRAQRERRVGHGRVTAG